MKKIYRDILILLAALVITWLVFFILIRKDTGKNQSQQNQSLISTTKEEKIAKALRKNVFARFDTISNPVLDAAIDSIEQRLTKHSDNDYNIFILQDSTVNAFATLRGDIFLFTGLIEYTSSSEMLASVIAHEMGHIENKHFVQRMSRQIGLQTVILIFAGGNAGTITQLAQNLLTMRYSREQEQEADKAAMVMLAEAGINPQNLTRFFLKLTNRNSKYEGEYMELFMSHPSLKNRIQAASVYKTGKEFHEIPFNLDWNEVQQAINSRDARPC
ncbi:MAG: M48 family metallopeptidase, partial [Bacteroidota bacterium]